MFAPVYISISSPGPFDFFNTGIPYDFSFAIIISASMVLRFESNNFSSDIFPPPFINHNYLHQSVYQIIFSLSTKSSKLKDAGYKFPAAL